MKWYHGTTPESAALIREHGFDMSKAGQRDVGDLGLGIYFTRNIARARSYGSELVAVELDGRFARIPNPYFITQLEEVEPKTPVERLFFDIAFRQERHGEKTFNVMRTVQGSRNDRLIVAREITYAFQGLAYAGIIAQSPDEAVIFDEKAIKVCQKAESENV